jgi:carboxymethylenebutenolidase
MRTEILSLEAANGPSTAYVAVPDTDTKKAVIVVQEYWGLNDNIKNIAGRYATEGFIAIVPDLYRGRVTADSGEASAMMRSLKLDDGIDTIKSAISAASDKYGIEHFGINGFCMGGTYALRAACLLEGISAAAPFYGDIPEDEVLKKLTAPTIFVAATQDAWINAEKVGQLEAAAEKYELPVEIVKYEADHAFFNSSRPEVYNESAAEDSWALAVGLFKDNL